MERLTKTYEDGSFGVADKLPCGENSYTFKDLLIKKLGRYEELEEQGRLIELPCAVGDTVWSLDLDIHWIEHFKVTYITVTEHGIGIENPYFGYGFDVKDLGDTVFLTKEEAEEKLKEMRGAE